MPEEALAPGGRSAGAGRGGPLARLVYRLLARCHQWAESGWGGPTVAGWGFLQGSVVPGPSDALLIPFGVSDPSRAFRLAAWATLGATLGGLVAYTIGFAAFEQLGRPLLELVGVSPARLAGSREAFARHGLQLVLLSTVSPLSTKAICVAAGAFGMPALLFAPALLAGRALRFFGIAILLRFAGPRVLDWLSRRVGVPPLTIPVGTPAGRGVGESGEASGAATGEAERPSGGDHGPR